MDFNNVEQRLEQLTRENEELRKQLEEQRIRQSAISENCKNLLGVQQNIIPRLNTQESLFPHHPSLLINSAHLGLPHPTGSIPIQSSSSAFSALKHGHCDLLPGKKNDSQNLVHGTENALQKYFIQLLGQNYLGFYPNSGEGIGCSSLKTINNPFPASCEKEYSELFKSEPTTKSSKKTTSLGSKRTSQSPPLPDSSSDKYSGCISAELCREPLAHSSMQEMLLPSTSNCPKRSSSCSNAEFEGINHSIFALKQFPHLRLHKTNTLQMERPYSQPQQLENSIANKQHQEFSVIRATNSVGSSSSMGDFARYLQSDSQHQAHRQYNNPSTSKSVLSSILSASGRTSPTVLESRTELCSGISSTPKSMDKHEADDNEQADRKSLPADDSPGNSSPIDSSLSGTSPSQGSRSGTTVYGSDTSIRRTSISPSGVDGDQLMDYDPSKSDAHHSSIDSREDDEGSSINLLPSLKGNSQRCKSKDQMDYERYVDRRRRNNEAAKRCRANRRVAFEQRSKKVLLLEAENAKLRQEMLKLNAELEQLKSIVTLPNILI